MIDRSRIRSCAGSSAAVQLADEIAPVLDLSAIEAPSGGHIVAIDGCASACTRRTLEARGLKPLAISLDQFRVLPDDDLLGRALAPLRAQALERLEARAPASGPPPRRRATKPDARARGSTKLSHSGNDYLYAIHALTSPVASCGAVIPDTPTVAAHVAGALSVSRATAGEMLARLEAKNLVTRGPAKEILLTTAGQAAAEQVVHRHRLIERFLVDILDYSPAESYDLAAEVRDAFPEIVTARLATITAHSAYCPHGWPVNPSSDQAFAAELVALSTLPTGAKATVAALIEQDAALLERLFAHGLAPGASLAVIACHDVIEVEVDGRHRLLERGDAAGVLVSDG